MKGLARLRCGDTVAGMDGCRGGWVVAYLRIGMQVEAPTFRVLEHLHELPAVPHVRRLFVDMPMGLSEGEPRPVERLARALLPPQRKSSVFPVPCRQAIYAESYEECCALNRRILGVGVPKQSFNIAVKIRELDRLLARRIRWRSRIFESHPEICFARLSDEALAPKRTNTGASQRRNLLERYLPELRRALTPWLAASQGRRPGGISFGLDDLLDASALAVCAALPAENLEQIPADTHLDARAIPMRIVAPTGRMSELHAARSLWLNARIPKMGETHPQEDQV